MGAFYLSRNEGEFSLQKKRVKSVFEKQGFSNIIDLSSEYQTLFYCAKINVTGEQYYYLDKNNFCIITGTLIYKKLIGEDASKAIFDDFSQDRIDTGELYGNFAIALSLRGELRVYTDTQGVYNVWHNRKKSIVSSSFLAVAEAVGELSVNVNAVYEYVFQEATFGGDTVLNEVRRLKVKQGLLLEEEGHYIDPLVMDKGVSCDDSFNSYLERSKSALSKQFEAITRCFSGKVDSALSGGYDSRLLLALSIEQGVKPFLHVYGSDDDADVKVAKNVCLGENLDLSHEDKSGFPEIPPNQFGSIVEKNFYAFQGVCPDGVLDNGSDLLTRHQRTKGGRLLLNGGGGEVFRNFFYLPNRPYRALNILWSFYSRFNPDVCTSRFNEKKYYHVLETKIYEQLGVDGGVLSRQQVESLYGGFRCTYWMGVNNSINNQFGYFLTPFVEEVISQTALSVPIKYKNYGCFQAKLINKVSPRLASYLSDYGHNFSETVPIRRKLKDLATLVRPTWLRKYTFRLKKQDRKSWPYYLGREYIDEVLPDGWDVMSEFFIVDKLTDSGQFNRAVTLEYLFQKLDVGIKN